MIVGLIHGLAGSGALMLLILSTIDSTTVSIAYILVFGIGSTGGMMVMSLLIGLPFRLAANRFVRSESLMRVATGLISLGFGLFRAGDLAFSDGFFQL